MMHFVFKTLKLLTLEFQLWKILVNFRISVLKNSEGAPPSIPPPPPAAKALLLQTLVQQIFISYFLSFDKKEKIASLISCNKCNL